MDAEASLSKSLYRMELYLVKVIPIIMSGIFVLNTALSYYDIDVPILSYIGGVSILTIMFLYLSSYVFKFCSWHRMFIHYITVNWLLNIIDLYIGIPVSDKGLFIFYMTLTGLFMFAILYLILKRR